MKLIKYLIALIALTLLAACGGGGGSPGLSTGGVKPVLTPTIDVQLLNSSDVVVANAHVTAAGGYYLRATLRTPDGSPMGGQLITFSVSPSLASLASATARTDSTTGEARVEIYPAVGATGGAATVQATAVIDPTTTATGTLVIDVASAGVPASPQITVQLFDSSNVLVTNAHVTAAGGYYAKATVKDAAGAPIGGQLVTFSVSPSIASLASATARTDSTTGEAKVAIYPTIGATGGAATLQADAIIGTVSITSSLVIDVAAAGVPTNPQIVVQLFNSSNVAVSNVTFGGGNYIKATFKNAGGVPIGSRTLTFSLNGATIAILSSPTALTNASGEAQVSIAPASVSTVGAATVSVQALDAGLTYSASVDFGVSPAAITLGTLTLGSSSLMSGGNTSVTISATSNAVAAAGVNVALTADCGTINPVATTDGSGMASATYSAVKTGGSSCSGMVKLTASASGAIGVKEATLTVAAPVANAINFVSATPPQIFVKSSGAAEQSVVLFKVLDSTGVAMPNIPVVFSLTMNPGGVGLGASGALGNVTSNSDALGMASISVFSGTIPGPVEVKAALASNSAVFTTSKNLTVASGPPSQNHLSLSVSTFNIEGWNLDGSSTTLTVRVADRQSNPVPDGTVINFTAEGGQVAPSCATKLDATNHAVCQVAFISQNPRPADGRVTVLAYAEGLKEYIDVNGNNAYDAGVDTLVDIGDAYRDDNENGQYDVGEFVIPKGGTTICAGAGGASPAKANTCTGPAIQAATVRQEAVLLFASSSAAFTVIRDAVAAASSFVTVRINSADHPLLPMPAGTAISAVTSATGCTIGAITPAVVPNIGAGTSSAQLGSVHSIALTCSTGGTIFITATTPAGVVSTFPYLVPAVYVPPPLVCTPPLVVQGDTCVYGYKTAPTFTSAPAVDLITSTSFRLTAMINQDGTGYYELLDLTAFPTAPCPSVAALTLPGNSTVNMSANTPIFVPFTGMTANHSYGICFVAKNRANISQASVTTFGPFTTLP